MLKQAASKEEIQEQREKNRTLYFRTDFQFLKGHLGVRPYSLSGLLATMGSGKSKLIKKIISECSETKRILVYLSEESIVQYQVDLNWINEYAVKNVVFLHENDIPDEVFDGGIDSFMEYFKQKLIESRCQHCFIDNITTSYMYSDEIGPRGQTKSVRHLLKISKNICGIFYVAHTDSKISNNGNNLIGNEDIRGNRMLPIQTEYLYTMQKFVSGEAQQNVITVGKHRFHETAGGMYLLVWDRGQYIKDVKIPFETVNKLFKNRNKLGGKVGN